MQRNSLPILVIIILSLSSVVYSVKTKRSLFTNTRLHFTSNSTNAPKMKEHSVDSGFMDGWFNWMTHPVAVVSATVDGKDNGMTLAWTSNASLKPPIVMIAPNENKKTVEMIKESKKFGISYLAKTQKHIAVHFGFQSGYNVDKFGTLPDDVKVFRGESVPVFLFEDALVGLECELVQETRIAPDRIIFFGKVVKSWVNENKKVDPLLARGVDMD